MAITPYVLYEDAGAAIAWLVKAFGFRKSGAPMKGPDGRVWHADLKFGEHDILLGSPGESYRSPKRSGESSVLMYVDVDDADKCYRRAVKAGAKIIEEPKDTAYGARRFAAEDLEGHRWYFAQLLERAKGSAPRKNKKKTRRKKKTDRKKTQRKRIGRKKR